MRSKYECHAGDPGGHWDRNPVLVLRGADVLTRDSVARIQRSGPCARWFEFAGCGHVPSLMHADPLDAVTAFLDAWVVGHPLTDNPERRRVAPGFDERGPERFEDNLRRAKEQS